MIAHQGVWVFRAVAVGTATEGVVMIQGGATSREADSPIWKSRNATTLIIVVFGLGFCAVVDAPVGVLVLSLSGMVIMPMGFYWLIENRWQGLKRRRGGSRQVILKRRILLISLQVACLFGVVLVTIRFGAAIGAASALALLMTELLLAREFTYPEEA